MAVPLSNGALNGQMRQYVTGQTITGLKRWSILNKELPGIRRIKTVHVYDFDNTLFLSPLPNPRIWSFPTIGHLHAKDGFSNGGWWHDPNILAATGEGADKEEPRAWDGWWNKEVVKLVELSMRQKSALSILLTGRAEKDFADLIKRIVSSKKLEFDMICLKPDVGPANEVFSSTMAFKQALLEDVVNTYRNAKELRIYEDRIKHVEAFRKFFDDMNKRLSFSGPKPREPFDVAVIEVAEVSTTLDPVTEVAEIQNLINSHNLAVMSDNANGFAKGYRQAISKQVFYTGYLINEADIIKLLRLVKLPEGIPDTSLKWLGNNVLIAPRVASPFQLEKAGGIGKTVTFRVTHIGNLNNKIWSARVEPVPAGETLFTDTRPPTVVLAHAHTARLNDAKDIRNWVPVDQDVIFDGVVGEKVRLKIERLDKDDYITRDTQVYRKQPYEQSSYSAPHNVRHHDDFRRSDRGPPPYRGGSRMRGSGGSRNLPYPRGGRGPSNRGGRRGRGGYKSLDDMGDRGGYRPGASQGFSDGPSNRSGLGEGEPANYDGGFDGSVPTMNY